MCTHKKKIFNRYAGQYFWVNCGCCPACLQEKANRRATRIRNHAQTNGLIGVFVTLTYDNDCIPYIYKSDVKLGEKVNVYRDCETRIVNSGRTSNGFDTKLKRYYGTKIVDTKDLVFKSPNILQRFNPDSFDSSKLPSLRINNKVTDETRNKCSVALYSDFQKFYKRLHINYERKFNKKLESSFYACTEYGETYRRAHIHAVLFCKPEEFTEFCSCVRSSWSYCSDDFLDIEIARNCASYVASYVNCGSKFPRLLKEFFRPKCAYSRNFGLDNRMFQLDAILEKILAGDMRYNAKRTMDGILQSVLLPIPHYVLQRWFPKCKGYSRLSPHDAMQVVLYPTRTLSSRKEELGLSSADIRQYATRLTNCYERFRRFCISKGKDYGTGFSDLYAFFHYRSWCAYYSTLIKSSHESVSPYNYESDYYFYDNVEDIYNGVVSHCLGDAPPMDKRYYTPNDFPSNRILTDSLTELYNMKLKQAKTTNLIMTQMGYVV